MKASLFFTLITLTFANDPTGKEGVMEGQLGMSAMINIPKPLPLPMPRPLPYPIESPYI